MKGKAFDQDDWAERAVHQRAGPEPTDDLRNRVLDGVRRALAEPAAPGVRRWSGAARWAAVAAVLIVGLALSQMAASVTPFFDRPVAVAPSARVRAVAEMMRQVSPGLTADEADRLALASASRGDLPAIPIANADTKPPAPDAGLNFQGDVR
jgi:hypothetical protein